MAENPAAAPAPAAPSATPPSTAQAQATQAPVTQAPSAPAAAAPASTGTPLWQYLAGVLALLALGAGALALFRRRREKVEFETVMAIERPRVPAAAVPDTAEEPMDGEPFAEGIPLPVPAEPEASLGDGPLRYALETTNLSISLINATLSYQVTVTNTSDQPIHNIAIFGDLASAHASLTAEEQLAGPGTSGPPLHRIPALAAGQSAFFNGQLRLPLAAVRAVRREQVVMFIPLARMRIEADGLDDAVVQTCVVGQKPTGPGAGLRPFRLDTGPRIYPDIGLRPLELSTPQAA